MNSSIKPIKYEHWGKEEVALLKELYPKLWIKDIAKFFPERNKATIAIKALALNLPSAKIWQHKDNAILIKHFTNEDKETLLKLLPRRSWKATLAQGERLGLLRDRRKPRIQVNESYFENWSANMAYLLGYILADGCIIKGTYKGYSDALKFGVQKGDVDILEKIKYELQSEHAISIQKNAARLCITSQHIVDDLKGLGIRYRKSLRETLSLVPSRFLKDYVRGIIDGDGSVQIDNKGYPCLSVYGGWKTIKFIRNYFLKEFTIFSKIRRLKKSKNGKYYLYTIAYHANSAKTLITHLYTDAPLAIDRKLEVAKRCMLVEMKYHQKRYTPGKNEAIKRLKMQNLYETHSS